MFDIFFFKVFDFIVEFLMCSGVLCLVDWVGFEVCVGEIFGFVGESGVGKLMCGLVIIGLID